MGYRILTDEHIPLATVQYLEKLGHDVERVVDTVRPTSRSRRTRGKRIGSS